MDSRSSRTSSSRRQSGREEEEEATQGKVPLSQPPLAPNTGSSTCYHCEGREKGGPSSSSCPLCHNSSSPSSTQCNNGDGKSGEEEGRRTYARNSTQPQQGVPFKSDGFVWTRGGSSQEHPPYWGEGEHDGRKKKTKTTTEGRHRKWRYFPGKNKFYCNGAVMTSPSIRFSVLCFALISVTFSLFIYFDGVWLGQRLSVAIPVTGVLLYVTVIVNMIRTSFSDPGILPRASVQESEYMERQWGEAGVARPPPRTLEISVNGQTIKSKYCFTCKMFRPPRASHCGVCDNCVDRFDHHCPFLGNCIGKRNYPSFYAFIISLSFLTVFVLSSAIAHLVLLSKEEGDLLKALKESPTSSVVVIISFFGMWTVLGLAGFHTYLIAMEQTTNEDIKGVFGRAATKNPFSRGSLCGNCCFVLCGPTQPSLIDARGVATHEFLSSLPKRLEEKAASVSTLNCNIQSNKSAPPTQVVTETGRKSLPLGAQPRNTLRRASGEEEGVLTRQPSSAPSLGPRDQSTRITMPPSLSHNGLYPVQQWGEYAAPAASDDGRREERGALPRSESLRNVYNYFEEEEEEEDHSHLDYSRNVDDCLDDPTMVTPPSSFQNNNTSSGTKKGRAGGSERLKKAPAPPPPQRSNGSVVIPPSSNGKRAGVRSTMIDSPLHLDTVM